MSSNKVGDVNKELEEKYKSYGEAYDGDFKGPISDRSCTDIICLILYLVFTLLGFVVAVFAFARGNPSLLTYPTDSDGKVCGVNEMEDKPFLYFFDMMECIRNVHALAFTGCQTTQICVKDCPNSYWTWKTFSDMANADERTKTLTCVDQVDFKENKWMDQSVSHLVGEGYCAPYTVPQVPVINRCMPEYMINALKGESSEKSLENSETLYNAEGDEISYDDLGASKYAFQALLKFQSWGDRILSDLRSSWPHILFFSCLALVVSFLWIVLLRFTAAIITWVTIVLFILIWLFATIFAFYRYNLIANVVDIPTPPDSLKKFTAAVSFQTTFDSAEFWLVVGIICGIVFLVCLLLLCFLFSRIKLAIKLFEEASKALGHMPSALVWPFIPFLLHIITVTWAVAVAVCLATLGRAQFVGSAPNSTYKGLIPLPDSVTDCDYAWELQHISNFSESAVSSVQGTFNIEVISENKSSTTANSAVAAVNRTLGEACHFLKYKAADYAVWFHLYNLFMFFWHFNFITGVSVMTLAGAFGSYYWTMKKPDDIPKLPVLFSFGRAMRYHTGSIAFGSLLIAIVQMIKFLLEYAMHKLKASHNTASAFLFRCLQCCFTCLEQLVKFIARKAYIVIAVHGKNFCAGAKEAWQLIMRNIIRAAVLTGVTRFLIVISVLLVTASIVIFAYFFFHGEIPAAIPGLVKAWPTLNYFYVPVVVTGVASFAIASVCFFVYDIGVETMFICFLEDCERNDGSKDRPYYMSKSLASTLR